jgi:Rrf2 family protein
MRFSTRSEYALRAVLELGRKWGGPSLSVSSIAKETGIPHQYLEQLIHHLRRGGLVTAFRGVKGGYRLSRKPSEISVGEILRCMEGDLAPFRCPVAGPYVCPREATCLGKEVWSEIASAVNKAVDGMTVAALLSTNP